MPRRQRPYHVCCSHSFGLIAENDQTTHHTVDIDLTTNDYLGTNNNNNNNNNNNMFDRSSNKRVTTQTTTTTTTTTAATTTSRPPLLCRWSRDGIGCFGKAAVHQTGYGHSHVLFSRRINY